MRCCADRSPASSSESITTIGSMDSGPAPTGASTMCNCTSGNDDFKHLALTGTAAMALVLTEEQSMLRDSARGLISDKAPVSHLRQLRDARDATGFSRELWKAFAEMGFSGLLVA